MEQSEIYHWITIDKLVRTNAGALEPRAREGKGQHPQTQLAIDQIDSAPNMRGIAKRAKKRHTPHQRVGFRPNGVEGMGAHSEWHTGLAR